MGGTTSSLSPGRATLTMQPVDLSRSYKPEVKFYAWFQAIDYSNPAQGGETPLADFRKVWRDLDPDVRERFERGGIRVVRHLRGPDGPRRGPWALERWDEVLARSTRAEAEALLSAEGIAFSWTPDGGLRLELTPPVSRVHPRTGERVWYNLFAARHLAQPFAAVAGSVGPAGVRRT